jgi:hypothetical protein
MGPRTKAWLVAGLIAFFAVDNYHMWIEEDDFPFCSHGLFNTLFQPRSKLLRFVLHDDQGHRVVVDAGRVIPIEWYRAVGLAENVFLDADGGGQPRKDAVARLLLDRLNREGWPAFDESYAAIRPAPGARFVGLEVVQLDYDFERYRYGEPLRPIGVERRFRYGSVATMEVP